MISKRNWSVNEFMFVRFCFFETGYNIIFAFKIFHFWVQTNAIFLYVNRSVISQVIIQENISNVVFRNNILTSVFNIRTWNTCGIKCIMLIAQFCFKHFKLISLFIFLRGGGALPKMQTGARALPPTPWSYTYNDFFYYSMPDF